MYQVVHPPMGCGNFNKSSSLIFAFCDILSQGHHAYTMDMCSLSCPCLIHVQGAGTYLQGIPAPAVAVVAVAVVAVGGVHVV